MKTNKAFKTFITSLMFLLVLVTSFQALANGSVCIGNCALPTYVNCNYIRSTSFYSDTSSGTGEKAVYFMPPDWDLCNVDAASSVGGVAPPFVPPAEVVLANTVVTYYHNDALGSPVAASGGDGQVLWREEYRPYGTRLLKEDGGTNSQWFTGKPHEEDFGLSYFGARWYDPEAGRFMGVDPAGVDPGNVYSFNRYIYANNNPYRFVDPDGWEARVFQSSGWMRLMVPGQVSWDNARTDWSGDNYVGAVIWTANMLAEQVLFVGTLGYSGVEMAAVRGGLAKGVPKGADDIFKAGRTPKASELKKYAEGQGWKPTQTEGGPLKYVDENGIPRVTIKQGSSRAPGSGNPHVELKDATGQRIDPAGNPVTRNSPGNHTPIDYDL